MKFFDTTTTNIKKTNFYNIIYIIIIGLIFFIIYYKYYVIERSKVYFHPHMEWIIKNMPNLHKNINWTFCGFNSYIQFLWYKTFVSYQNKKIAKQIYDIESYNLDDDENIIIAWGKEKNLTSKPKAILLLLHTIFGNYSDSANFAYYIQKELNWIPVSYSRRGHSFPLKLPNFNTVGNKKDLINILNKIKRKYPKLPIYAFGTSAGSSLLARYLGDTQNNSLISGAILLSPGYDFEKSISIPISFLPNYFCIKNAKKLFLHPNKNILESYNKEAFEKLYNSKTMKEWHKYQWKFAGNYNSEKEYYLDNNPIYVLHKIKCPILYINALDDMVFPYNLTKKFKKITQQCKNSIIVHTNRGGHLGFYEGFPPQSWAHQISKEFFETIHN